MRALTPTDANRVAWRPGPSRFYEVWYVIGVDQRTGDGIWLRYTLLNPTERHPAAGAQVWAVVTQRANPDRRFSLVRHFSIAECALEADGPVLSFGTNAPGDRARCVWHHDVLRGEIDPLVDAGVSFERPPWTTPTVVTDSVQSVRGAPKIAWDLQTTREGPDDDADLPLPGWLRAYAGRRSCLTIPAPKLRLRGTLRVDDRECTIDAVGHQAHHHGTERAEAWDWAHCAHFAEEPDAVLEILRPQIGPWMPTFLSLRLHGRRIRCDRPIDLLRNSATLAPGRLGFVGRRGSLRVEVEISAAPAHFVPLTYLSTSYRPSRCWNSQIADCTVRVFDGRRSLGELTCMGRAAAEVHRPLGEDPIVVPG